MNGEPICITNRFSETKTTISDIKSSRSYTGGEGGKISIHLSVINQEGLTEARVEYAIAFPYLRSEHTFHIYKRDIASLIELCNTQIALEYKEAATRFEVPNDEVMKDWFEIVPVA